MPRTLVVHVRLAGERAAKWRVKLEHRPRGDMRMYHEIAFIGHCERRAARGAISSPRTMLHKRWTTTTGYSPQIRPRKIFKDMIPRSRWQHLPNDNSQPVVTRVSRGNAATRSTARHARLYNPSFQPLLHLPVGALTGLAEASFCWFDKRCFTASRHSCLPLFGAL